MGIFTSNPEERAAKEAQREKQEAERRAHEQAEAFAKTPAGQARAAKAANRTIFQIDVTLNETQGRTFVDLSSHTHTSETLDCAAIIQSIEAEGWRLEQAGYVYRVTGSSSRDRHMTTGQKERVNGEIVGIYLFRAVNTDHQD